jgi:AraC family transcriptional activator of tynA and feaB
MWCSWDTSDVRGDRVEFWSDVVMRGVIDADMAPLAQRPFDGRLASRTVGSGRFVNFRSASHRISRTARQVRRSHAHFMVSLQCKGVSHIEQARGSATLRPGEIAVVDSGHPFEIAFPTSIERRLVLLPRELLERKRAGSAAARGPLRIAVNSATAQLARNAILHLTDTDAVWAEADCDEMLDVLSRLLLAALDAQRYDSALPAPPALRPQLERIKALMRKEAGDPTLRPATIAGRFGISVRTLHRLFQGNGETFSRFLIDERLAQAHAAIRGGAADALSLTALAMSCGFNDAAHFSRAYRARYGEPPSETRAHLRSRRS